MRKNLEKSLLLLKSAIMNFEMHYQKHAPLKSLFYYTTKHVKNSVLHYFSILRYFGRREDIFASFRRFWLVAMAAGNHFELFMKF